MSALPLEPIPIIVLVDELWLDHDLAGDDTVWPLVRLLDAGRSNSPRL